MISSWRRRPLQREVEDRHRHVWRGHADRVARQLALQLREGLGHGLRRARLGEDHVQGGRSATSLALVEVVDEVLVVRERVHRLDVATHDAVLVTDRLEHRHDRVRRARGRRENGLVTSPVAADQVLIDACDDVGQVALARSREEHPRDSGALEVLREAATVAPPAGVVDDDRVLDAVGRVVHAGRVVRVDDLDARAVGEDGVRVLVHGDGALERPVDRVPTQQARSLHQVVVAPLAHDDRPKVEAVAPACVGDEDPGEQAPDPTEAVEDDIRPRPTVAVLPPGCSLAAGDLAELRPHPLRQVGVAALLLVLPRQPGQVHRGGPGIDGRERLENGQRVVQVELDVVDPSGESVCLDEVDGGLVDEPAPVDRCHDVVLAVEPPDDGDHRLREGLTLGPLHVVLVGEAHRRVVNQRVSERIWRVRRCHEPRH